MNRFDRSPPSPKPTGLAALWGMFGGLYPFVLPLVWLLLPLKAGEVMWRGETMLRHGPLFLRDSTYVVACAIWLVGFAPVAWLTSLLYRRFGESWWEAQRTRLDGGEKLRRELRETLGAEERLLALLSPGVAGAVGMDPWFVVTVTSFLIGTLFWLVSAAIFTVLLGDPFAREVQRVGVLFIGVVCLRVLVLPPAMSTLFSTFMMIGALSSLNMLGQAPGCDVKIVTPWIWCFAALPLVLTLCKRMLGPRCQPLLLTDRRVLSLGLVRLSLNDLATALRTGGLKAALRYWWTVAWLPERHRAVKKWDHGGTFRLTRSRWSDVLTLAPNASRSDSYYVQREEVRELHEFLREHNLPWEWRDQRRDRGGNLWHGCQVIVDVALALLLAGGTAQLTGRLVGSAAVVNFILLPTYEAAVHGDAGPYEALLPRVVAARPEDTVAWTLKALSAEELQRDDEALVAWQRTLELTGGKGHAGRAAAAALAREVSSSTGQHEGGLPLTPRRFPLACGANDTATRRQVMPAQQIASSAPGDWRRLLES